MKNIRILFVVLNILGLSLLTSGCKIPNISAELKAEGKTTASSNIKTSVESKETNNIIELATLKGDRGFAINGVVKTRAELFGSVSDAGDINGDGLDDILISTPDTYVDDQKYVGQAYVIFGSNNLGKSGNFDLKELNGINGFVIQGTNEGDTLGQSISSAGDINNDGFDDIIITSPYFSTSQSKHRKRAYVVFGSSTVGSSGRLKVSSLNGSNGFAIRDSKQYRYTGLSVSDVGDVNDDGIDDIILGTSYSDSNEIAKNYVIYGDSQIGADGVFEMSSIDGSNGIAIIGEGDDVAVSFVSKAGDVNNDGIDDIILGAPRAGESDAEYGIDSVVSGDPPAGRGYVIFGSQSSPPEIKLSDLDGSNGFLMEIDFPSVGLGRSVSGAGDINTDGIDDIIIGSSFVGSYVVFGDRNIGREGTIDLSNLDGDQGFALLTVGSQSVLGISVSSAGDVNADGTADLAIVDSEPELRFSTNNTNSSANNLRTVVEGGIAYVIYGNANIGRLHETNLSQLNRQQGLILQDYGSYLHLATYPRDISTNRSISNLGDVNGDGIDDIIVGIPGASNRADSYVFFGNRQ